MMGAPRRRTATLLVAAIACTTDTASVANASARGAADAIMAATDPGPTAIAGNYRYSGGDKQREQLIEAIEAVVADMNFIARPIARKRLRESNLPSAELHLVFSDDEITIARPGRPTVSAPLDGSMVVWKSPDGDEFEVRHRLVGDHRLVQEFVGDGNRSENIFALDPDGSRLTVQTTITADRLPETLRFSMSYRRKTPRS